MTYFPLNVFDTREGAVVGGVRPTKTLFRNPHLTLWSQCNRAASVAHHFLSGVLVDESIAAIFCIQTTNWRDAARKVQESFMHIVRKPESSRFTLTLNDAECAVLLALFSESHTDHLEGEAETDLADFKRALGFVAGGVS